MKMTAFFTVVASVLLSHATLAVAESDALQALRASAATVPTNNPGIHTFAEPPAGFDPVKASDIQLAVYGFPPRPDPQADPVHYAFWERAMQSAKIHWTGELKPLPYTRPAIAPAVSPQPQTANTTSSGPQQIKTDNAAGVTLTNGLESWNNESSFVLAYAQITVPTAQMPFSSHGCTATDYTEVSLVGIDGDDSGTGNSKAFGSTAGRNLFGCPMPRNALVLCRDRIRGWWPGVGVSGFSGRCCQRDRRRFPRHLLSISERFDDPSLWQLHYRDSGHRG